MNKMRMYSVYLMECQKCGREAQAFGSIPHNGVPDLDCEYCGGLCVATDANDKEGRQMLEAAKLAKGARP